MAEMTGLRCKTVESLPAGEMVDKETGEVIKWSIRTGAYVFLPGAEFPDHVILPGALPLGDGTISINMVVKKDKLQARFGTFVPNPVRGA